MEAVVVEFKFINIVVGSIFLIYNKEKTYRSSGFRLYLNEICISPFGKNKKKK